MASSAFQVVRIPILLSAPQPLGFLVNRGSLKLLTADIYQTINEAKFLLWTIGGNLPKQKGMQAGVDNRGAKHPLHREVQAHVTDPGVTTQPWTCSHGFHVHSVAGPSSAAARHLQCLSSPRERRSPALPYYEAQCCP